MKRPDGTVYHFGYNSPLQSITDRYGNQITITRGPASENPACQGSFGSGGVPAGSVAEVSSSNGRAVYFCYDDSTNSTDITGIADNANPTIKKVLYSYGSRHRLTNATQYAFNSSATTVYQYNQGSSAGVGDLTTIIVNNACGGTNCGSPKQVYTYLTYGINALGTVLKSISSQLPGNGYTYTYTIPSGWNNASKVNVSLPDGANQYFYFDQAGYVVEDARNVGLQSVSAEYTIFSRGQQTIGTSGAATGTTEFVGQVQEQDLNQNTVRQTTYNYDTNTGNVLSTTLSPAPGQTSCCSSSAAWTYTYTTFNRLASAAEPLSYNGVGTTYSYNDTPSAPAITITDPLGRTTVVTDNPQGQPISVKDPMGHTSTAGYTGAGDLQSVTDAIGNTTAFQPDPDGRVTAVTSPLGEATTYKYDPLDDVTDIYDPLGNHTNYTYDLIGGVASVTTPNGNLTTVQHSANLAKVTVTDPLTNTTVTNLDGQGRHTDSTDKRGVETTYGYDLYGRPTTVTFDANSAPGYSKIQVSISNYDALDRAGTVAESPGTGLNYGYDGLDSVLAEVETGGTFVNSSIYQYDENGRRSALYSVISDNNQPEVQYGYDCADELVSMSNNGSSLQSCSPSNNVTNGGTNTQVGINYDSDGMPAYTVVDGIQTLFTRDTDERVTSQTFQPIPTSTPYGNLTYQYDHDGRMVDEGGSLAAVTMPQNETETFSTTDQLLTWNGYPVYSDPTETNLRGDPSTGYLCYTWDARNQLTAMGGCISGSILETYDPIARRQTSSTATDSLNFYYDGGVLAGWLDSQSTNLWNFLTAGGVALAGSYRAGSTTTTWVPLLDANGSTIALVNAAAPGSPPSTSYTYDPSGNTTVSGAANSWPFEYQGMEHELTDPYNLYYTGSANMYNPQLQHELSQAGAQSLGGPSGGGVSARSSGYSPGSPSSGLTVQSGVQDAGQGAATGLDATYAVSEGAALVAPFAPELAVAIAAAAVPVGIIVGAADFVANFLDDFFSGGGSPPIPRQLTHRRHPLYGQIIGVQDGLIPTGGSSAPAANGGAPSNTPPLQRPEYTRPQQPESGGNLDYFNSCNVFSLTVSGGLCALLGGACVASVPGEPEDAPVNVPACVIGGTSCIGFANDLGCCVKPHAGCENPERDFTKLK